MTGVRRASLDVERAEMGKDAGPPPARLLTVEEALEQVEQK